MKLILIIFSVFLITASLFLGGSFLLSGNSFSQLAKFYQSKPASVDVFDFATELEKDPIILDIRTPEEFAMGHIPGAINLDFYDSNFKRKLENLDPNQDYAIYCRTGNRSQKAMQMMSDLGLTQVKELGGGIEAWAETGKRVCFDC